MTINPTTGRRDRRLRTRWALKALQVGMIGLAAPVIAMAQPPVGAYFGAELGANPSNPLGSQHSGIKIDQKVGPAGALSGGWRFSNGVRVELNGTYSRSDVGRVYTPNASNGQLAPISDSAGHVSAYSVTGALLYDLPLHGWVQPYVGIGLGYGRLDLNSVHGVGYGTLHLSDDNTITGYHTVQFGLVDGLTYQPRVGFSVPLPRSSNLYLTVDYRFLGMPHTNMPVTRVALGGVTVNGAIPTTVNHYGLSPSQSMATIGLRYGF